MWEREASTPTEWGSRPWQRSFPSTSSSTWYPGWKPEHLDDPWLRMKSGPFTKADESRFWFVDFHWPRGFSPLGMKFVNAAAWSTQLAAHQLPLPPAGGLVQRMGGPFLYEGEVPVTSQWEIGYRAARIEKNMPKFLGNFDAIWEERKWELELGLGYFESYDFAGKSLAEIGQFIEDAFTFQNRAWEIHFEIMYPLLAIYLQLYGVCAGNGIDPGNIAKMLQGRDSKIMETDRAMWDLADEAKRLGIADLFDHEPDQIRDALSKAGGNGSVWLTQVRRLLEGARVAHRGHRRHQHPVVDREPGVATRPAAQLRAGGRASRLRRLVGRLASRAGRGNRGARARNSTATISPRSTSCSGSAPSPTSRGGTRSTTTTSTCARRSRCVAARWPRRRQSVPTPTTTPRSSSSPSSWRFAAATWRGRTSSRSQPRVTSTTTTTRTYAAAFRRSSARCPRRSKTRC